MSKKTRMASRTAKRRGDSRCNSRLLRLEVLEHRKMLTLGTWTALANAMPSASGGGLVLLSDGTVLAKSTAGGGDGVGNQYYKLTPSSTGSYLNGTWTTIAPMASTRLYYSTQVLNNGNVYVAGGEYGTGTKLGEVYDPLANTWTATPASGHSYEDANSEILPNGNVLQALVEGGSNGNLIYNPTNNTYTTGPSSSGSHDESAWVKLPDNSILFVDIGSRTSERYIPASNTWVSDASVPVSLYDTFGDESGPAFLLPNGKAYFTGSLGFNAIYTPSGTTSPGSWVAAPNIPLNSSNGAQGAPDAPGAMMANGNILLAESPAPTASNEFPNGVNFYEYNYITNTYAQTGAPGGGTTISNEPSYIYDMLDLPDGTVLFAGQGSTKLYVYTPNGSPLAAGQPTVSSVVNNGSGQYTLSGKLFNGISEGAEYGDDWQMASNYPIVRFTSGSNVFYGRTSNWSSDGVQTGNSIVTTSVTLPAGHTSITDFSTMQVIANGIASPTYTINGGPTVTSLSINTGTTLGGTTVTINGTNFSNITGVNFGSTPATIVSSNASQIVVTSPASSVGTVDVTVNTVFGQSATSSADQFTYFQSSAPGITSVAPSDGPIAGGTFVVIAGANLANASSVKFGSTSATILSDSVNRIIAISPAGSAGTVDISVTSPNGTSAAGSSDHFTYVTTPHVSGVSTTAAANSTFSVGGVVSITLTFNEPVEVTGTPQITLNDGGVAYYSSGSDTSMLTFSYTVANGQSTSDLDYSSTSALSGGSIQDLANESASLTLPSTGSDGLATKDISVSQGPVSDLMSVTSSDWTASGLTLALSNDDELHVYQTGTATDVVAPQAAPGVLSVSVVAPSGDSSNDSSSGSADLTIDSSNGNPIPAGGLDYSGDGGLIIIGSGTTVLSGVNTYTGGTTVSASTLILNGATSLPVGSSLTIGDNSSLGSPENQPAVASNAFATSKPVPSTIAIEAEPVAAVAPSRTSVSIAAPLSSVSRFTKVTIATNSVPSATVPLDETLAPSIVPSGAAPRVTAIKVNEHVLAPKRRETASQSPAAQERPVAVVVPIPASSFSWGDSVSTNDKSLRALDLVLAEYGSQ